MVQIRTNLSEADVESIAQLHGRLYAEERAWNEEEFADYVRQPLAACSARGQNRERVWIAEEGHTVLGCVGIVDAGNALAQLRWFLVSPEVRGQGIGTRLLNEAIGFARKCGYKTVILWTVRGLDSAARLYQAVGFDLDEEKETDAWGAHLVEQRYRLELA